jgi:hypothetical protein
MPIHSQGVDAFHHLIAYSEYFCHVCCSFCPRTAFNARGYFTKQ